MRIAIIGAGPTGLFLGTALARRGHLVEVVDRDPGPAADGSWARRGVMQFHHAHAFRRHVTDALLAEMPEAYERWRNLGAEPVSMTLPDGSSVSAGTRSRRVVFERALRETATAEPLLHLRRGHVDAVGVTDGRAGGLVVDGRPLPADLVIDASGRSGRATRSLGSRRSMGGSCGLAYVDRVYQLRDPEDPGPLVNPLAWQADFDGYQIQLFLHDHGFFSVVVVRPSADRELLVLREEAAFDAACRAIPGLSTWTDPARARPTTEVLVGGNLTNHYRAQTGADGRLILPGLVFVGDSVCTTTPTFGRGVATSLLQARELLRSLDSGSGSADLGDAFDRWCHREMRPWVVDHMIMDEALRRRWLGQDVDLTAKLPSDLVMKAGAVDPTIQPAAWQFLSMSAGPECLDAVEDRARAVYASGWRPPVADGPDRDALVAIIRHATPMAA